MNWLGQTGLMSPDLTTYPGYRFPAAITSHAVWLYHVFSLSLRDVELILAERGVMVTQESIRFWCETFGADFARKLRRRRPKPGDTWHLDEVFLRINGVLHYLWRAVVQHGVVLDILVQDQLDIPQAQAEHMIEPHRMAGDRRREAVSGVGGEFWRHQPSLPQPVHSG